MKTFGKFIAALLVLAVAGIAVVAMVSPATLRDAQRALSTLVDSVGAAVGSSAASGTAPEAVAEPDRIDGRPYPGDGAAEATIVAAETQRLRLVRAAVGAAPWSGIDATVPYRVTTDGRATLVLPERERPYTLGELAELAPRSVVADSDAGEFLVAEHLVVLPGADLVIGPGERVLLDSGSAGFSSIVVLGGRLEIAGTASTRASLESRDPTTGAPDTVTNDGRAYLRVVGGELVITSADVASLGFWSVPTGGIAIATADPDASTVTPATDAESGAPTLSVEAEDPIGTRVRIDDATIRGNAYGLAVWGVAGAQIANSTIEGSLVDGIVLDRGADDARVTATTAAGNGVDGIVVDGGSSLVILDGVAADRNGRNGITLDGRPLAENPGPTGAAPIASSGVSVTGASATGNARYGIEIIAGSDVTVSAAAVATSQMGIVVRGAADGVTIVGSEIADIARHAVSVRDDPHAVEVRDNRIGASETAVYVRNANANVVDNIIEGAALHGVNAVGDLGGSRIAGNEISGTGPAAIDVAGALDVQVERNLVDGWVASRSLAEILAGVFQPLTIVWTIVLVLVAIALVLRFGATRRPRVPGAPGRAPLQSYSRGVVDRAGAERLRS